MERTRLGCYSSNRSIYVQVLLGPERSTGTARQSCVVVPNVILLSRCTSLRLSGRRVRGTGGVSGATARLSRRYAEWHVLRKDSVVRAKKAVLTRSPVHDESAQLVLSRGVY
jgi:hypothetical protein